MHRKIALANRLSGAIRAGFFIDSFLSPQLIKKKTLNMCVCIRGTYRAKLMCDDVLLGNNIVR